MNARRTVVSAVAIAALLSGCGGGDEQAPIAVGDAQRAVTVPCGQTGTDGGYFYSCWTSGSGSVTMTVDGGSGYTVQWSNVGDFTAGKGWRTGSNRTVSYSGSYSNSGGGAFGLYGWTQNPLVEYYIVESPGRTGSPGQGTQVGTVTSDGSTYTIWKHQQVNQPCIIGNSCTFWQYISVRQSPRTSGTITVQNHFDAWAKAGLNLGSHDYQILLTEGWSGSGSASASLGPGPSCSTAPSAPSGVTAAAVSSSRIDLSWAPATAPSGCSVTYAVFRNGTQVATGVGGTSYSDTGLAASTAYQYAVRAVDSAGTSASSATVSATTRGGDDPGGPGACTATFTSSAWNAGFTGTVNVKAGSAAISGWTVTLGLGGNTVTQVWSATRSGSTFKNLGYNGALPAGGSTSFGFNGSFSGTFSPPTVVGCTSP